MNYFGVIYGNLTCDHLHLRVFYDFDEACSFAHDLVLKGVDSAGVFQYLRDYFFDQPMVEYIKMEVMKDGDKG